MKQLLNTACVIAIVMTVSAPRIARAQTWDEWFHQDWTQGEYDAQQIVALRAYGEVLTYGFNIVTAGIWAVINAENENMNLHRDFFAQFDHVNPALNDAATVADIFSFQYYIMRDMSKVYDRCARDGLFTADEVRYVAKVSANIAVLTQANFMEMWEMLQPDRMKMTEQERRDRICELYEQTQDQHAFVKAFGDDVAFLAMERGKESRRLGIQQELITY